MTDSNTIIVSRNWILQKLEDIKGEIIEFDMADPKLSLLNIEAAINDLTEILKDKHYGSN